ncbi:MAG: ABC-2 family transporter protein [Candidatus Kaiserbacteria bacterium]|nr:ABC-2 family transporter protein [Candidatus Kaiserbacteria bacterium]
MKKIRLARKIITTLLRDRTQYRGRLFVDTMSLIARCGVLLVLYYYVFELKGGEVNNTPFILIAWSMLFYFIFMTFRLRDIAREIMRDVQSGTVEILFSKPVSYLAYKMWWQIGSGVYSFLVAVVVGSVALISIVGIPNTMTIVPFIPTLLLVLFGGILLTLLIYTIVGLLSFWLEDISPVFWIVDKAVMILGGSYLPVALFPDFMYKLALYSPFGASQFITHTVYESWQGNWYILASIQYTWVMALTIVMLIMFSYAKQKVSVNGG